MIKLSANLSKKTPIPGKDFSSQQYGAAMEVEVSDAADPGEIGDKLRQVYKLLEGSVDAQLEAASRPSATEQPTHHRLPGGNGGNGGNGNGRRNGKASQAQIKAVFAISRDRGMSRDEIIRVIRGEFGVERPDDLDVRQASDLIGRLQRMERVNQ